MAASNLDAYNLKNVNLEGLIHEDVMSQIWDISQIPLPFTDRAGSGSHSNQYHSWRIDRLVNPVIDQQRIDGQEVATGTSNETKNGRRVGNHSEIRTKRVEVSTRAQDVNTIGYANELAYQVTRRQQELRRDVEATAMSNNGSVEGTDTVAGVTAGLAAWITTTNVDGTAAATSNANRGSLGDNGGWDATAADSLVAASTPGTKRALTEASIRDVTQSIYQQGGEANVLMCTPAVKRLQSEYYLSTAARVAQQRANESDSTSSRAAQGAVGLFYTDFGDLQIVPNRLQPSYGAAGVSNAFILDFAYIEISYLSGYRVKPLAKTSLSDNRLMEVDWSLCIKNWDALGAVYDIDEVAAMVAA